MLKNPALVHALTYVHYAHEIREDVDRSTFDTLAPEIIDPKIREVMEQK